MPEIVRVGRIHIIESLSKHEYSRRTGHHLFEELQPIGLAATPSVDVQYHYAETKDEVFACVSAVRDEGMRDQRSPLLHFETHGAATATPEEFGRGLVTASSELIEWSELFGVLSTVNETFRLNLLVFVAACYGLDLLTIILATERAPMRLIVGPSRAIDDFPLEAGAKAFYREAFRSNNFNAALVAANRAIDPTRDALFGSSAEQLFRMQVRGYFKTHCSEAALDERTDKIVREHGGEPVDVPDRWQAVRTVLSDRRRVFDDAYKKFLFVDRYPENADRFRVSFESCDA